MHSVVSFSPKYNSPLIKLLAGVYITNDLKLCNYNIGTKTWNNNNKNIGNRKLK